nr:hypothetical protein [Tanacetum cinerariifolium]
MANIPPNNPNIDTSAIVPAPVNPDHALAQPVGLGYGFAPQWIGDNIPNNQNGDDDDDMEMDDEAKVIDPYMDDGSNNPPPLNSEDEETPPTSPVIPDADGKMEKLMLERIDTEERMKKKFKEQDRHFVGLGCDNIEESVEATIRAERERVQNEANRVGGPIVASFAWECTFADFMKCSHITFRRNEGAVGLIRWIEKTKMVFTVVTLEIEAVTLKTWTEIKVMMTEEFCPLEEIQRMECELWNLRVEEMDISSYTTRFNKLMILCPGIVPTK